jgi:hypothetical protein
MHGNKLFAGLQQVKWYTPPLWITSVTEIEHPWRICLHSVMIHFWWNKALLIGIWRESKLTEEQQLLFAMRGKIIEGDKGGTFRAEGEDPGTREDPANLRADREVVGHS